MTAAARPARRPTDRGAVVGDALREQRDDVHGRQAASGVVARDRRRRAARRPGPRAMRARIVVAGARSSVDRPAAACGATSAGTTPGPGPAGRVARATRRASPGPGQPARSGRAGRGRDRRARPRARRRPGDADSGTSSADRGHQHGLLGRAARRQPCCSTTFARRWTSTSGMSMRTGQTSKQAPHSDEAYGSEAVCASTGRPVDAAQLRREDRADRAGVGRAVGVAAGPLVDRADVEAGRAPDAAQRLPADRVGQRVGAAVVEQDEVERLRARRRASRRSTSRCRGSSARRSTSAAAAAGRPRGRCHVGTSFSMPMTVIRTSGRVRHIRPLPSDSTTMTVPVSATAKLAPEMATLARRNFSRRWSRAASASAAGSSVRSAGAGRPAAAISRGRSRGSRPVAVDRRHEDVGGQVVAELDDQLGEVGLPGGDALARRAPRSARSPGSPST